MSMDIIYSRRWNARMGEFPYWVRERDPLIFNIRIIPLLSIQECSLLTHAPVIFIMSCQPKVQQIIHVEMFPGPIWIQISNWEQHEDKQRAVPQPEYSSSCQLGFVHFQVHRWYSQGWWQWLLLYVLFRYPLSQQNFP